MLVSPANAEKLFKWYERTGKATMEKRLADNPNIEYAELYGLQKRRASRQWKNTLRLKNALEVWQQSKAQIHALLHARPGT